MGGIVIRTGNVDDHEHVPASMRTGVGRALIGDLVEHATSRGVARMNVTANDHALAFYEALGFVHDGVIPTRSGVARRMHPDIVEVPRPS